MKKGIAVVAVILMMSLFASCGSGFEHDVYKEIYKRYNHMESFYAAATVTVRNVRNENTYHVRQFYVHPDKYSIVFDSPEEVSGSGYTLVNGKVVIKSGFDKNEEININATDVSQRNSMFLPDFFEEYYKSEESAVLSDGGFVDRETVLECYLPPTDENRFSQKLWIDNKTYLPVKLETYDSELNPRVTVTYTEFKRNCDIDEEIFR